MITIVVSALLLSAIIYLIACFSKKLKEGEQIDIKRLSITNDCLDKVKKKIGMKY